MLIEDPGLQPWLGDSATAQHYAVPIGVGVVVMAFGWWLGRRERAGQVPERP